LTGLLERSPTISPLGVRLGAQTPRVRRVPAYVRSYGAEVVDFMAQIGRALDPWQATIVVDAFGVRDDGLWSAYELLLLLSRQNGKGGVTEAVELGGLFLFKEPLILHSAHQFKTSTAAFRRLIDIIDASDWLSKRVKQISRSKGDEGIYLTRQAGGGALQFIARTLSSGRGLTGSKNVFDEAWALTVPQFAAQTPTLATIPNPQIIYTTTPPDDDIGPVPEDAMLPSVRRRALAGDDRVALYEWSPADGFDRADRDVWYECNPALGIRISEWFLARQLAAFTEAGKPGKFDTEHLGVWPLDTGERWQVIGEDAWRARADPDSQIPDGARIALGLAADPDHQVGTIGVVGMRADGRRHVEVIERHRGTSWMADSVARMVELNARWRPAGVGVLRSSAVAALIAELQRLQVPVIGLTDMDYSRSCEAFRVAFSERDEARHIGQGSLDRSVAGVRRRENVEGGWRWSRQLSSADISPLQALCAAWHAMNACPDINYDVLESVF
jgi:hypothetical protein